MVGLETSCRGGHAFANHYLQTNAAAVEVLAYRQDRQLVLLKLTLKLCMLLNV